MTALPVLRWRLWPPLMLGLASFALRWSLIGAGEYAPGWDGYFYLVQVKAMVEEGAMHSADSSPIYPLLRGLYHLTGDYVTAFQLLCALLAGLFTALSCWAGRRISGSMETALVVAAWTVFSPSLTFFAAQFPKNLLGMNALLLLLGFSTGRKLLPQVLALVGAFWSHRMTAGLSLIFLAGRSLTPLRLLGVAVLGGLGLVVAWLAPGLLHPVDWERFSGAFQAVPQFAGWSFIGLMEPERMHLSWMAEIAVAFFFLGYWLLTWFRDRPTRLGVAFFLLLVVLIFPFFQMDVQGMGYRFFLSFMLLAPLVFAFIPHILPRSFFFLATGAFLALSFWGRQAYQPEVFDPDYAYYHKLTNMTGDRLTIWGREVELIIAHKGLAEVITFETGMDALPWQPELVEDSNAVWRVAYGFSPQEYGYYLGGSFRKSVMAISIEYVLVQEMIWQMFVEAVREEGEEDALERLDDWRNPRETRPAYLQK